MWLGPGHAFTIALITLVVCFASLSIACVKKRQKVEEERLLFEQEKVQEQADARVVLEVMQAVDREKSALGRVGLAEERAVRLEEELRRVRELARRERLQMTKLLLEKGGLSDAERAHQIQMQALELESELQQLNEQQDEELQARIAELPPPGTTRPRITSCPVRCTAPGADGCCLHDPSELSSTTSYSLTDIVVDGSASQQPAQHTEAAPVPGRQTVHLADLALSYNVDHAAALRAPRCHGSCEGAAARGCGYETVNTGIARSEAGFALPAPPKGKESARRAKAGSAVSAVTPLQTAAFSYRS